MRSLPEGARGRLLVAVLIVILAGACSSQDPSPSPSDASPLAIPEPGRPFDAATILDAMRGSRRPGGVPDQLETEPIAAELAQRIWTIDGEPWATISVGASCGPVRCTVDVAGSRPGSLGDDSYAFEVIPEGEAVAPLSTDLRSMPPEVAAILDRLAREAEPQIGRAGLALTSARWLPPPDHETFELSYRSGNEEGFCELELSLDVASGEVETRSANGC